MKPETHATLSVAEVLDLKAAMPLASAILAQRGNPLALDLSQVRRLGGQCLQILLSAKHTWIADELSLEFINLSQEFTEALEGFGISAGALVDQELSR